MIFILDIEFVTPPPCSRKFPCLLSSEDKCMKMKVDSVILSHGSKILKQEPTLFHAFMHPDKVKKMNLLCTNIKYIEIKTQNSEMFGKKVCNIRKIEPRGYHRNLIFQGFFFPKFQIFV